MDRVECPMVKITGWPCDARVLIGDVLGQFVQQLFQNYRLVVFFIACAVIVNSLGGSASPNPPGIC